MIKKINKKSALLVSSCMIICILIIVIVYILDSNATIKEQLEAKNKKVNEEKFVLIESNSRLEHEATLREEELKKANESLEKLEIEKKKLAKELKVITSRSSDSTTKISAKSIQEDSTGIFNASAYDLSYSSCGKNPGDKYYGITASNTKVRPGVVAVDTRVIPFGTKLKIEGFGDMIFVAEDTGGAIKGNKIDIFFSDRSQALQFGRKNVKVTILK